MTESDSYDVVVIGTGLGGISAAALLAKDGLKVLAVEQGPGAGGYAHAFTRNGYVFDPAVHATPEREFHYNVLRHLGVDDRVNLIPLDTVYGAMFPDASLRIPHEGGRETFAETHAELFPHERDGIRAFVNVATELFLQAAQLAFEVSMDEMARAQELFPVFFKYRAATVAEVADEFLTDPRAKAALTACWPYLGVPPTRLSFMIFAQLLNILIDGSSYSEGTFQRLIDAYVHALETNGGSLVVGTKAESILVEDGQVAGVALPGGRVARARVVVSNADAKQTIEELLGTEHVGAGYMRKMGRLKPSLSAFVVFTATRVPVETLGLAHETFLYDGWDHDRAYEQLLAGTPDGVWLTSPTVVDPSLAPAGEHLVICSSLMPYDIGRPWEQAKEEYTERMLEKMERIVPGLRDELTLVESATPRTLEDYTLNQQGAIYGWEISPRQTGSQRLKHETPVRGLFLSGHWTQEGVGSFRAVVSGVNTAREVLAYLERPDRFPDFKRADLPKTLSLRD